jgi:hypothetical protein
VRRSSNRISALALASCLWPAFSLAGPLDVRQEDYNPHQEPIGHLSPDEILMKPQPRAAQPAPPPPPAPNIMIDSPSGIDVGDAAPALDRFGIYDARQSGFDERVWEYLTQDEALALLEALPEPLPYDARRDAIRRLLLTTANPPRNTAPGWLSARMGRLVRLGLVTDATGLLNAIPESLRDRSLDSIALFIYLITSQHEAACNVLDAMPQAEGAPRAEPYERLDVFCALVNGKPAEAELAVTLRREHGNPFDDWFSTLIDSLQYKDIRLKEMPEEPSGIDLAMLFSAGTTRLPAELDITTYQDDAYLPYHWLIGTSTGNDAVTRAQFLESAIRAGNGDAAKLAELYNELALSPPQHKPLATRAKAYHALASARSSTAAATALMDAYKSFANHPALADAILRDPTIALSRSLKPGKQHVQLAPKAFALLMATGQDKDVDIWLRTLDVHEPGAIATYVTHELARFARVRPSEYSSAANQLPPLTIPEAATPDDLRLLQRFYRVMPAFGYRIPDVSAAILEEKVAQSGHPLPQPTAGWPRDAIQEYTQKGSVAGLLLATTAEKAPLSTIDDGSLLGLIDGLNRLGQPELARKLALESLLQLMR